NLQRQSLFDESDVAGHLPKAAAAAGRLSAVNSEIDVRGTVIDLTSETIRDALAGADVVVDGTDNFETRYLVNDYCVAHGTPWVYAGVLGSRGSTMTVVPGSTPCLRCVFPVAPEAGSAPTCDTAGVFGPAVHLVAAIQTSEAIKLALGGLDAISHDLF